MKAAKKEKKPVYIHFTADWCKWCRVMEKETYAATEIDESLKTDWICIKIDTEARNKSGTIYTNERDKSLLVYMK